MKLYGEISKTEEQDDGTIKVWGYASSDSVDSDGEVITSDAMKAAQADYMKFGAVREMHQAKAAGTAIEFNVEDDGRTYFGAHVVDSEAVKKIKTKVYKGFSIGGKVTERDDLDKSIIKAIKLVEVSLVDRPANPDAVFTMYKAETIDEPISAIDQLAELLNKGEITPEKLIELAKVNAKPVVAVVADGIQKGMWTVQDFASVLMSLGWICSDSQFEAECEGDNSPVPAKLRAWLADGIAVFNAMATEETTELLASLKTQAGEIDVEVIQMAAKTGKLVKAGAKFSADTVALIQEAHDSVKKADDALSKLGYDKPADDDEADDVGIKAAATGDLVKASKDALSKVLKVALDNGLPAKDLQVEDMAKFLNEKFEELKKVAAERDSLQKRVAELEAMPAPGKALLKAVGKSADIGEVVVEGGPISKVEPVKDAFGEVNDVATLIKAAHRGVGASRT